MPSLPVSQASTCICQRRCSIRTRNDTRSLERLGHPQVQRIEYEDKRCQYLAEYDFIYKFRELFAKCREDSIPDEHRQILREAFARKGKRFIQPKRSNVSELKKSNYFHKSLSKIANNRRDVLDKYIQSSEVCTYPFLKEKVDGCEARKNAAIYQKLLIFRLQQYQRALQIREKFIGIKSVNYQSSLQGETLRQNLEHSMKGFLETNEEYERYRSAESILLNGKQLIEIHRQLKLKEKGRRFRNKQFKVRLFSRA